MLAHLLHLGPRDVDELTVRDFCSLVDWIDRHEAALAAARKGD